MWTVLCMSIDVADDIGYAELVHESPVTKAGERTGQA